MGQAKQRGTKDERVADALEGQRIAQEARDRAEMAKLVEESRRWANMTQAQRDAALERAKREARNYGELQEIFGHDAARFLATMM